MSRALFERQAHDSAPRPLFARTNTARHLVLHTPDPANAAPAADAADVETRILAARADAEVAVRASMRGELDAQHERLAEGLGRLDRAVRNANRLDPTQVVELALIAAREIIGHAAAIDHQLLLDTVNAALDEAGDDAPSATVRLAPEDLAWLQEHEPARFVGLRLVEDARLEPGGCVVETVRRVVDATIEARLDAVRKAIHGALSAEVTT